VLSPFVTYFVCVLFSICAVLQETLVNLIALLCNLALIPMVTGKPV